MYYVYELINLLGTVEYVGHSSKPKWRFYQHIKVKPKSKGHGMFYLRQDLSINLVSIHENKIEALREEIKLQKFWGFETEYEKRSKAQKGQRREKIEGEKNLSSKLTLEQIKEIKFLLSQGVSGAELGRKFCVSKVQISRIKNGKSWSHIK